MSALRSGYSKVGVAKFRLSEQGQHTRTLLALKSDRFSAAQLAFFGLFDLLVHTSRTRQLLTDRQHPFQNVEGVCPLRGIGPLIEEI
jgi:hypothetical protein